MYKKNAPGASKLMKRYWNLLFQIQHHLITTDLSVIFFFLSGLSGIISN